MKACILWPTGHGCMDVMPEQFKQACWNSKVEGLNYGLKEDLLKWNVWFRAEKNLWTRCYWHLKSKIWFKTAILCIKYYKFYHWPFYLATYNCINYYYQLCTICLFNVSWFLLNVSLESLIKWDIGRRILHMPYWPTHEGWKGGHNKRKGEISQPISNLNNSKPRILSTQL